MNVRVGEMRRIQARLCREERGQNLVELALVLPFLLFLIFGVIDFARAYNYKDQTTQVANETARWFIVDQIPGIAGPSLANYRTWAQNELVSQDLKGAVTSIGICFTDQAGIRRNSNPQAGDSVTVRIVGSIPGTWQGTFNLDSQGINKLVGLGYLAINGQATMRIELTPTQAPGMTGDWVRHGSSPPYTYTCGP